MHTMFSRLRTLRKSSKPVPSKLSSEARNYRPVCQGERVEDGRKETWEACIGVLGAGHGGQRVSDSK